MNALNAFLDQLKNKAYLLAALFLIALGSGKIYYSNGQIISGDGIYYYAQARSLIVDMDWSFANEMELYQADHKRRKIHNHPETERVINKYPIGSALLWLPFLFLAYWIGLFLQFAGAMNEVTGYGLVDQFFLLIASIFYFLCSARLLYLIIREIFPQWKIPEYLGIGFLSLTTALYYTAIEPAMSHIPSLFSISLFLYLSFQTMRKEQSQPIAFLYGASAALMILVRNQNVFFLILPLYFLLINRRYQWRQLFLSVLGGIVFLAPQFIYWKIIYNEWILYSYQGERFAYLDQPKFFEVLFSPISGLISWHPVHLFSALGLIVTAFLGKSYTRLFLLLLMIQLYLYGSWECWWLGDSFGYRGLANGLPVLFVGFAWFYQEAERRNYKFSFGLIGLFLFLWNIYLMVMYAAGKIAHAGPLSFSDLFGWWSS